MVTCPTCGRDVTNRKFCPDCGTAVPQSAPSTRTCPACQAAVAASSAFCTQCGHDMRAAAPRQASGMQCPQCGRQNAPDVRFCGGCGYNLTGAPTQAQNSGQAYPPQPYQQPNAPYPYQQNPYQQNSGQAYPPQPYQQPYPQQQPYGQQGGYQPQPMLGQQPMVLRCPTCMAMAPMGTPYCASCRTNLAGVVPTPAGMPMQGQQQGGFFQGNNGKMAMGALGGAAAVIGGEMLLNGIENRIEDRDGDDRGYGYRHHHREEEDRGPLGGIGELADDLGLF